MSRAWLKGMPGMIEFCGKARNVSGLVCSYAIARSDPARSARSCLREAGGGWKTGTAEDGHKYV